MPGNEGWDVTIQGRMLDAASDERVPTEVYDPLRDPVHTGEVAPIDYKVGRDV